MLCDIRANRPGSLASKRTGRGGYNDVVALGEMIDRFGLMGIELLDLLRFVKGVHDVLRERLVQISCAASDVPHGKGSMYAPKAASRASTIW